MQTALIILYALLIIQSAFLIHIGLRILAVNETHDTPPKPVLKPLFKAKPKPTEEEIRYEKILANIDAYDGSGKGQTKI